MFAEGPKWQGGNKSKDKSVNDWSDSEGSDAEDERRREEAALAAIRARSGKETQRMRAFQFRTRRIRLIALSTRRASSSGRKILSWTQKNLVLKKHLLSEATLSLKTYMRTLKMTFCAKLDSTTKLSVP